MPRLRREVWAKLKHLQTDACAFANLPEKKRTQWALTREEMKNDVWLKPELVAQIEFTEWNQTDTCDTRSFVGWRDDIDPREVVREWSGSRLLLNDAPFAQLNSALTVQT